jgi:hypothetical protein
MGWERSRVRLDQFTTIFGAYNCLSFVATFEGNSRTIQPGSESTVCVIFSPNTTGCLKQNSSWFFMIPGHRLAS